MSQVMVVCRVTELIIEALVSYSYGLTVFFPSKLTRRTFDLYFLPFLWANTVLIDLIVLEV